MTLAFTKYTSLAKPKDFDYAVENYLIRLILNKSMKDLFVLQEKIHGANFSFAFTFDDNGTPVGNVCSRNQPLGEGDSFKGKDIVIEKYMTKLEELAKLIKGHTIDCPLYTSKDGFSTLDNDAEVIGVHFFGEIAGRGIQSGVTYGDDGEIDFYGFDILLHVKQGDTETQHYLPFVEMVDYYSVLEIPVAPILKIGKLRDLYEVSPEFNSNIAGDVLRVNIKEFYDNLDNFIEGSYQNGDSYEFSYFRKGVEDMENDPKNVAEGYIIRPVATDQSFFYTRNFMRDFEEKYPNEDISLMLPFDLRKIPNRLIFKIKTEKFVEKRRREAKEQKPLVIENEEIKQNVLDFLTLINDNRVNAVLSKEANISPKKFGEYLKLILEDCLEEFGGNKEILEKIITRNFTNKENDYRVSHKMIFGEATKELRTYFSNNF